MLLCSLLMVVSVSLFYSLLSLGTWSPVGGTHSISFLWVSWCLTRSSRIVARVSPETIGVSQAFHRIASEFSGVSTEFRQNIELEHLTKGDNHISAFAQSAPQNAICVYMCVCIYIYIYIYIEKERER